MKSMKVTMTLDFQELGSSDGVVMSQKVIEHNLKGAIEDGAIAGFFPDCKVSVAGVGAPEAASHGLNDRQLATVLAALRAYQRTPRQSSDIHDVATNGGELSPLDDVEIDELCESLNFGTDDTGLLRAGEQAKKMPMKEFRRVAANTSTQELQEFAENFRSWHSNHFEDFSPEVNVGLLALANEAAAALGMTTEEAAGIVLLQREPRFGDKLEHAIVKGLIAELDRSGFVPVGIHYSDIDRGKMQPLDPKEVVYEIFEIDDAITLHFARKGEQNDPDADNPGVLLIQGNGVDIISDYHAKVPGFSETVDRFSDAIHDDKHHVLSIELVSASLGDEADAAQGRGR
jgi:hypothetical protein